jgi:hypothetical protein
VRGLSSSDPQPSLIKDEDVRSHKSIDRIP